MRKYLLRAIALKVASAFLFAVMSALVRFLGENHPVGQIVFFRSAAAVLPVLLIYAWQHELDSAVRTTRPLGHLARGLISVFGMFCNFAALARIPIVDATAIGFAAPLFTVALAALILKERVRIFRWSAVIVGFFGILVMLVPNLDPALHTHGAPDAVGVLLAIVGAFCNAASVIQTRRLTATEATASIVFYFSLSCALAGLATWPFGWVMPDGAALAALVAVGLCGGVAHILLTESYRLASAALLAPFDYTAMVWAFLLGYFFFGELPTRFIFVGGAIVTAAGLFVIWRERRLGLMRARAAERAHG
jgi:drug/metabolite transporter (DMT)-like permease